MKEVNEMPTEGQFVAVYTYNGNVWSGTYAWDADIITEYFLYSDDFEPICGTGEYRYLPWICNEGTYPKFFVEV